MILSISAFSCPLILAAIGALFSEYTGSLALFMEGIIGLSAFFAFTFSVLTHSPFAGFLIAVLITTIISGILSFIVEKTKANKFIAALGINLIFSASISLFSSLIFKSRGVLTSEIFVFNTKTVEILSVVFTVLLILFTVLFLILSQKGIYFRITGTNPELLTVRGINPDTYRMLAWPISAFFASFSGIILATRISAYVPGISGGKGWMALAAVFLGRKKWWQIIIFILIFCAADYLSAGIQNYLSSIPSSIILALPYLVILILLSLRKSS